MKLLPDTIAGRTIAVLLAGLLLLHLASIWAYQFGIDSEVGLTNETRLAERLLSIRRAIDELPVGDRERVAHSLSGGPLEVHWSRTPLTVPNNPDDARGGTLRRRIAAILPDIKEVDLVIGTPSTLAGRPADPHLLLVSMRVADDSWVNYSITKLTGPHASLTGVVLSTTLMALGVLAASVFMLRNVTRPLRSCAAAAERLYVDAEPTAIPVTGPREVRGLAAAFNAMQQRVKRLVDDRTLTLAAISHDLKTPLTRAQLRIEDIADTELRAQIEADLGEMLSMIDATLDFLRGDQTGEAVRSIDLATILESICGDLSDAGHAVTLVSKGSTVLPGRHLALKRAFNNLIANAVKYGTAATVAAAGQADTVTVTIADQGPGIPADRREAVFAPFYRLEDSRSRETGGVGLGLTVARSIIRTHGGEVHLEDGKPDGLIVRVVLPIARSPQLTAPTAGSVRV